MRCTEEVQETMTMEANDNGDFIMMEKEKF
jgi:hypothetical protein